MLLPHVKVFQKTKGLELVSLPHFPHDFLKKNVSLVIFFYCLTKF